MGRTTGLFSRNSLASGGVRTVVASKFVQFAHSCDLSFIILARLSELALFKLGFFFFFSSFSRDLFPPAVSMYAAAGGGRLPTRVGKDFVQGGCGPASTTGGNSSRDAARARCAATARMPLHLTTHAALAAAWREVGTSAARARASKRMNVAASGAHLPPTSSPNTTRWQRRARSSSG